MANDNIIIEYIYGTSIFINDGKVSVASAVLFNFGDWELYFELNIIT